jgi:hypothetical protein
LKNSGPPFAERALILVNRINVTVLLSVHEGRRPQDQQLRELADVFVRQEGGWCDIDAASARAYLSAVADRTSPHAGPAFDEPATVAFAIGGWLLSAFIPGPVRWTDFLDGVLREIESTLGAPAVVATGRAAMISSDMNS